MSRKISKAKGNCYLYKDHYYQIYYYGSQKCSYTGEWEKNVIYKQLLTDVETLFCREQADFFSKFIPIEKDTIVAFQD